MKTANRKPKLNKKPSRGLKKFMHQQFKSLKNVMARAAGATQREQNWYTPKAMRSMWLLGFNLGKYTPHQGHQEKARRVRQMQEGKCI